ncbi:HesA/MoeB/ThiF family protein [Paraglaciecola aquimarina]|uniref:HesA/MoeB/ThiF family protein n=1 Tax=Paraglaciecola aquimarina TaxID=1235557 RepID=A0ABU3SSH3_9ALTE|nr:HesA/MoeB/ThiF family protein [Paraglaciecola aquimarina]MDU0352929.1 HesA/MoeB/ThiF family protein [Paraglaciecola aquimarina]
MTQLTNKQLEQYYRQVLLPQVEEAGQLTLLKQRILIVGMGGLGTHCAQQLSAAGIGHLHLMDDDEVELSNLPRQILYSPADIGHKKVTQAQLKLTKLSDKKNVSTHSLLFSPANIQQLLANNIELKKAFDQQQLTILDCSDNMPTRQAVNTWCVTNQVPLVSAAVSGFDGQLMLIDTRRYPEQGCYHCIFKQQHTTTTCAEMGVLGPTVGVVASMQSLMTLQQILEINEPIPALHIFTSRHLSWRKITRQRDPLCSVCQNVSTTACADIKTRNDNTKKGNH